MDIKDVLQSSFRMFFTIFAGASLAMIGVLTAFELVFAVEFFPHYFILTIMYLFVAAMGTALTQLVFYAKKELSSKQLFLRYCIQLILVIGIMLVIAWAAEWRFVWFNSVTIFIFVAAVTAVFFVVHAIELIQIKIIANSLNKELKRRDTP